MSAMVTFSILLSRSSTFACRTAIPRGSVRSSTLADYARRTPFSPFCCTSRSAGEKLRSGWSFMTCSGSRARSPVSQDTTPHVSMGNGDLVRVQHVTQEWTAWCSYRCLIFYGFRAQAGGVFTVCSLNESLPLLLSGPAVLEHVCLLPCNHLLDTAGTPPDLRRLFLLTCLWNAIITVTVTDWRCLCPETR